MMDGKTGMLLDRYVFKYSIPVLSYANYEMICAVSVLRNDDSVLGTIPAGMIDYSSGVDEAPPFTISSPTIYLHGCSQVFRMNLDNYRDQRVPACALHLLAFGAL
jgi:hypothetical protein